MELKLLIILTGIFFILIALYLAFYMWRKNQLARILNLNLNFNPEVGYLGGKVDFVLSGAPDKTIKTDWIEGDLTCLQYNAGWMQTLDDMDLPGLRVGRPVTSIVFSMGKDMIFAGGVESTFEGYLPIPEDSFPTETTGSVLCRWMAAVRIHVPGFMPAVVIKELPVAPEKKNAQKIWVPYPKIEEKPKDIFTGAERLKDNVIVVMEGDATEKANKPDSESSCFSFLELEEDRQEKQS